MNPETDRPQDALAKLEAGQYQDVITLLTDRDDRGPLSALECRALGLAYLRSGKYAEGEIPLLRASALGDMEAKVEYGNLLRLIGQFSKAAQHFADVELTLEGELKLRAWRWWGTAEFQAGETEAGLRRCEQAWYGYMATGDQELIGRVTQTLAQMHLHAGDIHQAETLYQAALRMLPTTGNLLPRATALRGLVAAQLQSGGYKAAEATLKLTREATLHVDSLAARAHLLSLEAELYQLQRNQMRYIQTLKELKSLVDDLQDFELQIWTASRLADHHSSRGFHSLAVACLGNIALSNTHPTMQATLGILLKRRGHLDSAITELNRALASPAIGQHARVRALLHLADAYAKTEQGEACVDTMLTALNILLTCRDYLSYQVDIEELTDLVQYALFEPATAGLMDMVRDRFGDLLSAKSKVPQAKRLHLRTLGKAEVELDGEPIRLSLEGSLLTLAYLALHPRQTRHELEAALYPDKEPETAGSYLRAVFRELRTKLGDDAILMIGNGQGQQPHYSLGPLLHVELDVQQLQSAIRNADIARIVVLYNGGFMEHLKEDCPWVKQLREKLSQNVVYELRVRMETARENNDLRRALLLANQAARIDPYNLELLEERMLVAREIATPSEIAQYSVEMQRLFN